MFKAGDEVVCISTNPSYALSGIVKGLTIGKKYQVVSINEFMKNTLYVMNDVGVPGQYYNSRFMTLIDYRKLKLEKLLNNITSSSLD